MATWRNSKQWLQHKGFWIPLLVVWKLAEDRALASANNVLDELLDAVPSELTRAMEAIPFVTWVVIGIVLLGAAYAWVTDLLAKLRTDRRRNRHHAWVNRIIAEQYSKLAEFVHVFCANAHGNLADDNPFIDFDLGVTNGSVFTVIIAQTISGHVRYQDRSTGEYHELRDTPEVPSNVGWMNRESGLSLEPNKSHTIRLRQWLLPNAAQRIAVQQSCKFDWGNVDISIIAMGTMNEQVTTAKLTIPNPVEARF